MNPAPLTVSANNAARPYGQPNPAFSASYNGFLLGDTIAVLSGLPSLTTTATTSSTIGNNYTILAAIGNLQAANYAFSFVNGTLTITQATPPITWGTNGILPAISYGTSLASSLNATSPAVGTTLHIRPGEFRYFATTVLPVGTQTLTATFVPNDTTDYTQLGDGYCVAHGE